jgi:hypothetical protein
MRMRGPEPISLTAHYTGYVWARNGLSHPELATREGRVLFEALHPATTLSGVLGGPTLGVLPARLPGSRDLESMWSRFARQLAGFRVGRYLSDVQLGGEAGAYVRAFRVVLAVFVRGRVHLHFADAEDAAVALERAGFSQAAVHPAAQLASANDHRDPGAHLAHVPHAG